jgi:hypothetical protein
MTMPMIGIGVDREAVVLAVMDRARSAVFLSLHAKLRPRAATYVRTSAAVNSPNVLIALLLVAGASQTTRLC